MEMRMERDVQDLDREDRQNNQNVTADKETDRCETFQTPIDHHRTFVSFVFGKDKRIEENSRQTLSFQFGNVVVGDVDPNASEQIQKKKENVENDRWYQRFLLFMVSSDE